MRASVASTTSRDDTSPARMRRACSAAPAKASVVASIARGRYRSKLEIRRTHVDASRGMPRSAHKLAALLAVAAVGGAAGLGAGGLAEAKPRAKARKAAPRARPPRVGTGQAWVPPGSLGAQRAPLAGTAAAGADIGAPGG